MAGQSFVIRHPWDWKVLDGIGRELQEADLSVVAVSPPMWDVIGVPLGEGVLASLDRIRRKLRWMTARAVADMLVETEAVEHWAPIVDACLRNLVQTGIVRRLGDAFRLAPVVERQEMRRGEAVVVDSPDTLAAALGALD